MRVTPSPLSDLLEIAPAANSWAVISTALSEAATAADSARRSRMRKLGAVGGLTVVGRHGPDKIAERARSGLWKRFEAEADPASSLGPEERRRRALLVQRKYYTALAIKSAAVRRARATKSKSPGCRKSGETGNAGDGDHHEGITT